jgi:hypothetical protein
MATVAARRLPSVARVRLTGRVPAVLGLALLVAVSLYVRSRVINGSFWMDEGLSVGIASHHFFDIPGVLHQDGSPPLYYLLLHLWMSVVGRSEAQTHGLSLVFAVLMIPAVFWAAWSLFGRRAAWIGAALAALNPFLTAYAQETRMYSLMALLGLLTSACLVHAYVHRKRRYLPWVAVGLAAMLYTHGWGLFFAVGSVAAVIPLWRQAPDRRAFGRDFLLGFGGAALLFAPWLPTLLFQAAHTGAPWGHSPRFGVVVQISRGLLGGDRAAVGLVLAAGVGIAGVLSARRGTSEPRSLRTLALLTVATLAVAWLMSQISPAWTVRYFAAVLGPLLLLIATGLARAGRLGFVALGIVGLFWINPSFYTSNYKSDVRDIAATLNSQLHPGDLVIVGQPEQVPVVNYYMPPGLRYANTIGAVADPGYMNWADALDHLKHANPGQTLGPLIASLRPGQHVVLVRPITDGVYNWTAPWTLLVRRRSAQWSELLARDRTLKHTANAPPFYKAAATVGNSAVLYTKTAG